MIVKSMSRKQASFAQLFDYIVRDNDNDVRFNFTHNCFGVNRNEILTEFYDNASLLARRKGSNYLYHDIISITRSDKVSEDEQKERLRLIAKEYIDKRAKDCLVFGGLHDEKDNQLHYHLIISANQVNERKRYYHSKAGFEAIKVNLEEYVLSQHAELEQAKLISADKTLDANNRVVRSKHANKREGEMVRRTGKLSKKQQVANQIRTMFESSNNLAEYMAKLRQAGITSYVRGNANSKTMGFVVDGRKHRLSTLGLVEEFDEMLHRFENERSASMSYNPYARENIHKHQKKVVTTQADAQSNQQQNSQQSQQHSNAQGKSAKQDYNPYARENIHKHQKKQVSQQQPQQTQQTSQASQQVSQPPQKPVALDDANKKGMLEKTGDTLRKWVAGDFSAQEAEEQQEDKRMTLTTVKEQQRAEKMGLSTSAGFLEKTGDLLREWGAGDFSQREKLAKANEQARIVNKAKQQLKDKQQGKNIQPTFYEKTSQTMREFVFGDFSMRDERTKVDNLTKAMETRIEADKQAKQAVNARLNQEHAQKQAKSSQGASAQPIDQQLYDEMVARRQAQLQKQAADAALKNTQAQNKSNTRK